LYRSRLQKAYLSAYPICDRQNRKIRRVGIMRTNLVSRGFLGVAVVSLYSASALAVSDGNYDPALQHCTGGAERSDEPSHVEPHCHSSTLVILDGNGHEYFGIGTQQMAEGQTPLLDLQLVQIGRHQIIDVWHDAGQATDEMSCPDTCRLYTFDDESPSTPAPECCEFVNGFPDLNGNPRATNPPADPTTGLRLYMGADDNLDAGEHDSSETMANGPSDGGAVVLNLNPASLMSWMAFAMLAGNGNPGKLLVHPLPIVDGGFGACADGFCVAVQTTRRDRAYVGGTPTYRPVADYTGHAWDPPTCAGPTDSLADCAGSTPGGFNAANGDPAIEPGVQIFEDPDAQASPLGPVYPIPAVYVGTCGAIIGGGALSAASGAPSDQSLGLPPTRRPHRAHRM